MTIGADRRIRYRACHLYLGHNSGALLYNGPSDFFMIEEEKENRQKGGEYLPLRTLLRLRRYRIDDLYVINFLGDVDFDRLVAALCNYRPDAIAHFAATTRLHEVIVNHHYTHAIAAILEAWTGLRRSGQPGGAFHVLVSDGTGHDYEAITLYSVNLKPDRPLGDSIATLVLIEKIHATRLSCGLLFGRLVCNADTGFAVLKDEFKSLGYESEIGRLLPPRRMTRLNAIIERLARAFVFDRPQHLVSRLRADMMRLLPELETFIPGPPPKQPKAPADRPILLSPAANETSKISLLNLRREPDRVLRNASPHQHFAHGLSLRRFQKLSSSKIPAPDYLRPWLKTLDREQVRVVCSYIANRFIEAYSLALIRRHNVSDLIVAGGVHFNVKLNRTLLCAIPGRFCATPLAGDIAHVPAIAAVLHPELAPRMTDLRWLARALSVPEQWLKTDGVVYSRDEETFLHNAARCISQGKIVNVIKGWGEYGPRALMNTSTLCLPSEENRRAINVLNGRDDHMPMAPVLREQDLTNLFEPDEARRVIGSLTSMIVALAWRKDIEPAWYGGVMHRDATGTLTGRPQIVCPNDRLNYSLLSMLAQATGRLALINTSFNIHGKATAQTARHAFHDYAFQRRQAEMHGLALPVLLIGDFKDQQSHW